MHGDRERRRLVQWTPVTTTTTTAALRSMHTREREQLELRLELRVLWPAEPSTVHRHMSHRIWDRRVCARARTYQILQLLLRQDLARGESLLPPSTLVLLEDVEGVSAAR